MTLIRRVAPILQFHARALPALAALLCAPAAFANPVGPQVVGGRADFAQSGSALTVTNTPGAIINWQGFSIGSGEVTRFVQQSAQSSVLNRVLGPDPSSIYGTLSSNGRVFLVNPAGIVVGAGGRIDVAGFVATTLQLGNEDFLAGRYRFGETPGAGAIVNAGTITTPTGGRVYLAGPVVDNRGRIDAPAGQIVLAAGQSVQLVDTSTPGVQVEVSGSTAAASNVGELVAHSGQVGIVGTLVRNAGTIDADQVERGPSGRIFLVASARATLDAGSRLQANGAQGGRIDVGAGAGTLLARGSIAARGASDGGGSVTLTGERVALARVDVDASGATGGGSVKVGGDFHGANPAVQDASRTYFAPDATIRADALGRGDGGSVVVWSDDLTRAYGSVSARGGPDGGNGGFVEISGRNGLRFGARVDVAAPAGELGTLLLDPRDIVVQDSGGASDKEADDATIGFGDGTANSTFAVDDEALESLTANIVLQASRDITVDAGLSGGGLVLTSAGQSLTLQAGRHITVGSPIVTQGGKIVLEADSPHSSIAPPEGVGQLTIDAPVTSNGGAITLIAGGNAITSGGGIRFASSAVVDAGAGGISVALSGNADLGIGSLGIVTQILGNSSSTGAGSITNLHTTGPLVIGTATSGGSDGRGTDAVTLLDRSIDNTVANSAIILANGSGSTASSLTLAAGDGGITLGQPLTTYQPTTITTTGPLQIDTTVSTGGSALDIVASSVVLGAMGAINTAGGAITCSAATGCDSILGATADDIWTGSGDGYSWFDASNWSAGVPGAGSNVTIGGGTITVVVDGTAQAGSINASRPIEISGSNSLTLAKGSTFSSSLTLAGAAFLATGDAVVVGGSDGALFWSGGALTGAGSLALDGQGTGLLSGALTLNLPFQNSGALTLAGAALDGTGSLSNLGTLTAAAGTTNRIGTPLTNAGAMRILGSLTAASFPINTGDLIVAGGGAFGTNGNSLTNTTDAATGGVGTIRVETGGTLDLGAGTTFANGGTPIALPDGSTAEATATFDGDYAANGTEVSSGTVTFNGSASTAALTLSGGTVAGTGSLSVTSDFNQTGGVLGATFADLALTKSGDFSVGALAATNSISLTAAGGALLDGNGAAVNVTAPAATFAAANGIDLDTATATLAAANSGTGDVAVRNAGALTVSKAGVRNAGGAVLLTGTADVALNGSVVANGASENAIVIAGAAFTNNAGAGALDPGSGRWLVYSSDPSGDVFGGLDSGHAALWNATYAGLAPASVTQSGDRYVFAFQPTVTFASTDVTKTYGADASAAVSSAYGVSGLHPGVAGAFLADTGASAFSGAPDVSSTGSAPTAGVAGGPYAIVVAPGSLTARDGYALAYASTGKLTVDPAPLTVTASDATKTYGQTTSFSGAEFTANGLQNGETIGSVTLTSAGAAATAGVAGGPYAIVAANAAGAAFDPANYAIRYVNGALTVSPALLTVTANNDAKTYDGHAYTGGNGVGFSGFVNGEDASVLGGTLGYAGSAQGALDAGGYVITPRGLSAGNYAIVYVNGTLSVNPALLTVTAGNDSKTYDGRAYGGGNGVSFSGFVNGEDASVLGGTLGYGGSAQGAVNAGGYVITPQGLSARNYSIAYVNGSLAVNPAPLAVTANDDAKTYDGRAYGGGNGVGYSGFVNGEDASVLGGSLGYAGGAQGAVNAGGYVITPRGLSSGNYAITFHNGTLTVNPAVVSLAARRVYNGTTTFAAADFGTVQGVNGETLTVTGGATVGSRNAGTQALASLPALADGTGLASNYTLAGGTQTGTITPRPIMVSAQTDSKTYDGTTSSSVAPVITSGSLVAGDSAAIAQRYDTKDAGTGKTLTASAAIDDGNGGANYSVTYVPDETGVVTPATLVYTADPVVVPTGGSIPALSGSVGGLVGGDTLSSVAIGTPVFTSTAPGTTDPGNYAIVGGGLEAISANYVLAQAPANSTALVISNSPLASASILAAMNSSQAFALSDARSGPTAAGEGADGSKSKRKDADNAAAACR